MVLTLTALWPSFVRVALSLALILFFPGYGITALLFPRRALDLPARLLLSIGLSLATTAFTGLILHLSPWGIQLKNPLIFLLLGGTGLIGLYFLVRDILSLERATILTRIGFNTRQVLVLVLAATITIIAVNVARTPTSPKNLTGYTLLWVQPGSSSEGLKLGVQSEEFKTTKYQLRFEMNGTLREGPTFELKPGQTWEYVLQLDGDRLTGKPITLLLYRLDRPDEVYRRVVWWYENN